MGLVRRAGRGRLGDTRVTWTVAEGRRGRRWREVVVGPDGGIRHSLLHETDPDGRFSHLELATPAGLLTLHPEGDGTLHGNAVTTDGVRHVVGVPWTGEGIVLLAGSPVAAAAAWRTLVDRAGHAVADRARGYAIDAATLGLEPVDAAVVRAGEGSLDAGGWRLAAAGDALPRLDDGDDWPLEEPV